ncbi:helicase : Helicase domain protein OS=Desulforudis audaxviator (strain MP104C) GN=Daud_0503 PE=4 SV=1 [Gemmata massiliana]|uniref:Helicase: Helicase domain protein n=1 Tax=Gemmata massiliana TaxID=1210884 RepID=A0A6P2DI34_9BACT|nr:hypothetical protein [Gemmata massiliana]VTS00984.1 helicase : Helicase domain protein OS=Desulforudis audaxviator (strain MP104C) GN=Daud_0503 PE=4 SV=1 [Gemmata massiliana]
MGWGRRFTSACGTQTPAEPGALGDLVPAKPAPAELPAVAYLVEPLAWIQTNALDAFLEEVANARVAEVKRVEEHVELSLKELLHKADEEIGRAQEAVDERQSGAEGRLAQAHTKYDDSKFVSSGGEPSCSVSGRYPFRVLNALPRC